MYLPSNVKVSTSSSLLPPLTYNTLQQFGFSAPTANISKRLCGGKQHSMCRHMLAHGSLNRLPSVAGCSGHPPGQDADDVHDESVRQQPVDVIHDAGGSGRLLRAGGLVWLTVQRARAFDSCWGLIYPAGRRARAGTAACRSRRA